MRFSEPMRMADGDAGGGGESHSPVWSKTRRRRSGGSPLIGLVVTLLALFGALTLALSIKERSVAGAGTMIDGWVSTAWNGALGLVGKAPEAADRAGAAAERTGDALEAGAEKAADELKAN